MVLYVCVLNESVVKIMDAEGAKVERFVTMSPELWRRLCTYGLLRWARDAMGGRHACARAPLMTPALAAVVNP